MMFIDMTPQLGVLLAGLDVTLVAAATAIAVSAWHHQRSSFAPSIQRTSSTTAVVGRSTSAPVTGAAPSDTSVPEAA